MALEVPVVATRIAGVPRLIRHGDNGLLVEPGSVEELAGALGRLLRDDDLRDRLRQGRAARRSRRTIASRSACGRSGRSTTNSCGRMRPAPEIEPLP